MESYLHVALISLGLINFVLTIVFYIISAKHNARLRDYHIQMNETFVAFEQYFLDLDEKVCKMGNEHDLSFLALRKQIDETIAPKFVSSKANNWDSMRNAFLPSTRKEDVE